MNVDAERIHLRWWGGLRSPAQLADINPSRIYGGRRVDIPHLKRARPVTCNTIHDEPELCAQHNTNKEKEKCETHTIHKEQ